MKDILSEIVANKRQEVAEQKKLVSLEQMMAFGREAQARPVVSMRKSIANSRSGIIAEFKRRSPSKGWLFPDARVEDIVPVYERGGASACSVLTDEKFFGGTLNDLIQARKLVNLPLLRKDFIIDNYQLYEARMAGADAVLLIASVLSEQECLELSEEASRLGLEILLEIHDEKELSYLNRHIDLLGVNNRHLGTFHTDVENSFRLLERMRGQVLKTGHNPLLISESGISDPLKAKQLRAAGFNGFLIGEYFMRKSDIGSALTGFINEMV